MIAGNSAVLVRENDELVDVVNRYQGQGVLNLLSLDGVPEPGRRGDRRAVPPDEAAPTRTRPPSRRVRHALHAAERGPRDHGSRVDAALASAPVTLQHLAARQPPPALGAKMVPFGGWEMPIQYPTGTLAEHQACRTDAAAFDVSHLGTVRVTGAGCARPAAGAR